MTHYSARAQWNTANARLANKPFDDLFAEKKPAPTLTPVTLAPVWIDLAEQFKLCEQWNDADQWEALGFLYLQRYGPFCMNAAYCFRKADEGRTG